MKLKNIVISQVRNLCNVSLELSTGLNIFIGENASGKTSFLESLHLLAYARSFRSHHVKHIVNKDAQFLRVSGKIIESGNVTPIGIEFREGRVKMKAGGVLIKKTSELAQYLPIIVMHQECQRLLSDGPKLRRKFLDRGVFHVEQNFASVWRQYFRVLRQRNLALQQANTRATISVWNIELKKTAALIHKYRQNYCDSFIPILNDCLGQLINNVDKIKISYHPGWDTGIEYITLLEQSFAQDCRRKFTHKGPHRADLAFSIHGVPVQEVLSRGQQKLFVCSMLIAQAYIYSQRSGKPSLFLIDDLKAELDDAHIDKIMLLLNKMDAQIFITTTDKEMWAPVGFSQYKTFHVERGCITEMV